MTHCRCGCNAPPDDGFWVMINMSPDPVDFRVPAAGGGDVWRRLVDTAVGSEKDDNCWPEGEEIGRAHV